MKIKANGISFNCQVDGREGAPWVVLSNSLMTNLSAWDEQVAALRDCFRILRYDQRGHGGTDAPAGPYRFNTLVDDVAALFAAFGITRAHFIGLSMGGMTAVALAEQKPLLLDRIIPCDFGPASTPQSAQQWDERIVFAKEKGMDAMVDPTVGRWFVPAFLTMNETAADRVREMIRTTPLNGFIGCAQALSDFDLRPGLANVKSPTLFLCGSNDSSLPGTMALHAGIAGSKFLEIPNAGHISNVENPTFFTRAIREFLLAPYAGTNLK